VLTSSGGARRAEVLAGLSFKKDASIPDFLDLMERVFERACCSNPDAN